MADPIREYVISRHAAEEMHRRQIDEAIVHQVMAAPEQRHNVRLGRDVLQSRIEVGGRMYLVRVIVDVDRTPAEVVTAYRTSSIARYWRAQP